MINKNKFNFIVSASLDNLGDGLMTIFFPLLMLTVTNDPVLFSLSYVMKTIASVFSSFLSGYALDFYPIYKSTRYIKIIRIFSILIFLLYPTTLVSILTLAFFIGATEVFIDNSNQTISLDLYEKKELIDINNKLQSIEYFLVFFVGPIAGSFVFKYSPSFLIIISTSAYLVSLIFFSFIKRTTLQMQKRKNSVHLDLFSGVCFIFKNKSLMILCLYASTFCLIIAYLFSVFPIIIANEVADSILYLGFFYAINSLGFVMLSSLTPIIHKFMNSKKLLSCSLVFLLSSTLLTSLSHSIPMMFLSVFLLGCGMGCWGCVAVTYRQKIIPGDIFSRTNAVYRLFSWSSLCIGGLLGGGIFKVMGIDSLFFLSLAFSFCLTLSFYFLKFDEA